jgi:hydroxymethylbilane synthase
MTQDTQKTLPPAIADLLATRPIRLGTRGSPLAMAQAYATRTALCAAYGLDETQIEIDAVKASGDKITDRALREVGGKALWTRELDMSLGEGSIDFAVHSMKDVETLRPPQFMLAAVLPRADARDMLVGAESLDDIAQGATLGTSSPRRGAQMLNVRPDMSVVLFRGNVATRLQKLADGVADVTLLAKAGLDRLGESVNGTPLDLATWLPAASQGVVGIEARADDTAMQALLRGINDDAAWHCLMAERQFLEALGGNCHSAVAAYAVLDGGNLHLDTALYSEDGAECLRRDITITIGDKAAVTAFAKAMLADAPDTISRLFDAPA